MEQEKLTKKYNKKMFWHRAHRRWAVFWYILGVIGLILNIGIGGLLVGGILGIASLIVFIIFGKISDRLSRHSYNDAMSISQQIQVNAANVNVSNTSTAENKPSQFNPTN